MFNLERLQNPETCEIKNTASCNKYLGNIDFISELKYVHCDWKSEASSNK